jgi:hypothetical protein
MNLLNNAYKKPVYSIEINGKDITVDIQGRLIALSLTDNRGFDADQLDITLDDSDGKLDLPTRGGQVRLSMGWQDSGMVDKGSYTIDEVDHSGPPDVLIIRARSADLRSGLSTQRERSFHCSTVGLIVNLIAEENDLIPMVSAKLADEFIDHVDQTNESSVSFLSRLAKQFDAVATVKNGRLLFIHAAAGVSASGKPLPGITLTRQSGDRHQFTIADRESYSHVKATWNDTGAGAKGEVIWGKEEDAAENGRSVSVPLAPAGTYKKLVKIYKNHSAAHLAARKAWRAMSKGQRTGFIGVTASYNDRNLKVRGEVPYGTADEQKEHQNAAKLAKKDADRLGVPSVAIDRSANNIKTLRHIYSSMENAKRAARANWRKLQRGMAGFSITLAYGQPDLIPEMPATVQGWKPAIDSTDWILSKVTHSLNDNGLTTHLDLEIKATEITG